MSARRSSAPFVCPPRQQAGSPAIRLRLGTRGSRLALAQAHAMSALLANLGYESEIVTIRTSGDKGDRDRLGAFVREIQIALLNDEVDLALHCLKDLPTTGVEGLALSAYLPREDPRDTIISRGPTLMELPHGAIVGTGSVRRTSQLASVRPDLQFRPLMGNVDSRMRRLMAGEYDAIVLAIAGLKRLGVLETWAESEFGALVVHPLDPAQMMPAPGQAVLVLETRADDAAAIEAIRPLHDEATRACAEAERDFLAAFGGGCSVPVAALATPASDGRGIDLDGLVASPDGATVLRGHGADGAGLAQEMGARGAFDLFVPVTRDAGGAEH